MHKIILFFQKKNIIEKKICMLTLPKIFRPKTHLFFFYFALCQGPIILGSIKPSGIFVRVLFSRNFTDANFSENKSLVKFLRKFLNLQYFPL